MFGNVWTKLTLLEHDDDGDSPIICTGEAVIVSWTTGAHIASTKPVTVDGGAGELLLTVTGSSEPQSCITYQMFSALPQVQVAI